MRKSGTKKNGALGQPVCCVRAPEAARYLATPMGTLNKACGGARTGVRLGQKLVGHGVAKQDLMDNSTGLNCARGRLEFKKLRA